MRRLPALCLVACCTSWAQPQTVPSRPGQPTPSSPLAASACPDPQDVLPLHLYGVWRAQLDSATGKDHSAASATLWFERHSELADSVGGRLVRGAIAAQLAGDVDSGRISLEESVNGRNISATWSGVVVAGSCGKEMRGTWTNAAGDSTASFVLRKQTGW